MRLLSLLCGWAAALLCAPVALAEATREPQLPVPPRSPSAYETHLDARRLEGYSPNAITRLHPSRLEQLVATPLVTPSGLAARVLRLPREIPLPSPAVAGQRLFVGGGYGAHEFYALDAASLKPVWGVSFDTQGPAGALPLPGGLVLAATAGGELALLNQADGRRVWQRAVGEFTAFAPAVGAGVVVSAYPFGAGHRLAAYRLADGAPLFERQLDGPPVTAPVIHGDSVVLSTFAGTVHRFLLRGGHRVWSQRVGAVGAPRPALGRLWVMAKGASGLSLVGLDWNSGAPKTLWSAPLGPGGGYLSAAQQKEKPYATLGLGLDLATGQYPPTPGAQHGMAQQGAGLVSLMAQWAHEGLRPVISHDVAWISHHTQLSAVSLKTGKTLWRFGPLPSDQGGLMLSQPVLWAGRLYVAAANGELRALDPITGHTLWAWQTGHSLRATPTVAGGRLYVPTTTGQLIALDL